MIEIDGSIGGGQLLRSALTCSVVTGKAVTVEDIRAGRPSPGLRPQHLAAVRVMERLSNGRVEGASLDSTTLEFEPGDELQRSVDIDIGTAGSITLVFDTVAPLASTIEHPIRVAVRGGTDVKWSPSMGWYRSVKLPFFRRWGIIAAVDIDRRGFYPAGGGAATIHLAPSDPSSFTLLERGDRRNVAIHSIASDHLEQQQVAERQAEQVKANLEDRDIEVSTRTIGYMAAESPGSAVTLAVQYRQSWAGFDALGERGVPAETIGERVIEQFDAFDSTNGVVDRHLADQILLPLALTGGECRVPAVSDHVETSLTLLDQFGFSIDITETSSGPIVRATPPEGMRE